MDLMRIASNDLEFGDKIGSGGEGSVFKGKWRLFKNGWEEIQDVAIKMLLTSTDLSELQTLSGLSHPNIINVFGFVKEHHELCIVMELCQYSLRGFFERNPFPLSDENLLRWSLEAALPLEYLRKHNILHRDVKPENYVVDSGMVLKLTDFGAARDLDCTVSKFTQVGTWRWMAPEVHGVKDNRLLLSPLYDIFALGLVMWYLVARKIPYSEFDNNFAIAQAIINGKRPAIPAKCPVKLADLIQKCWSGDRRDRPDISQIILLIKDLIVSLETTGTLLRIEDMASVEITSGNIRRLMRPVSFQVAVANPTYKKMTDTNPVAVVETPDMANLGATQHLTNFWPWEASGPPKTQAISSSQADMITKTKIKSYLCYDGYTTPEDALASQLDSVYDYQGPTPNGEDFDDGYDPTPNNEDFDDGYDPTPNNEDFDDGYDPTPHNEDFDDGLYDPTPNTEDFDDGLYDPTPNTEDFDDGYDPTPNSDDFGDLWEGIDDINFED